MSDIEIPQGWESFDAAVYKFAHECAEAERNEAGSLEPPAERCGPTSTSPRSSGALTGVSKELENLDEDLIQGEVEGRFVWLFQEAWREEAR
jgi:hypothetical protein